MSKYIGTPVVNLSVDTVDVSGDITATDSTPELILLNDTHEDTDGGREGKITFKGEQSGGEVTVLAQIQSGHDGTSDDEKGDLIFKTNDGSDGASPTEALRIDSEQNLGLGTNSPDVRLHVTDSQEQLTLSEGGSKGATFDYRSSTGFLQIATNGVDARANPQMTLDLNGKLRVGVADDAAMNNALTIDSGNTYTALGMKRTTGVTTGTGELGVAVETNSQITFSYDDEGSVVFGTAATPSTAAGFSEKMRINSSGNVGIGNSSPAHALEVTKATNADFLIEFNNTGTSVPYGMVMRLSNTAVDSNATHFMYFTDSAAVRFAVDSDGDVRNHDNSYGAISDERVKEQISDATSQWDDIKALKVRKFKLKDDVRQYGDDAKFKLGLISQETELVSPNLILEASADYNHILSSSEFGTLYTKDDDETKDAVLYTSDDEEVKRGDKKVGDIKISSTKEVGDVKERKTTVKGIRYSILYMKAVKALQEAMARIETLETKVAALEGE